MYTPVRWEVIILEQRNKLQYTNPECHQGAEWTTQLENKGGSWKSLTEQLVFKQTLRNKESDMQRFQEVCSRLKELRLERSGVFKDPKGG